MRYDLHCHSTCSDGELSVKELLQLAKERGLSGIAITDHDTVAAFTEENFAYAKSIDISLLVGVEFSCMQEGESVHILGYGFRPDAASILELCKKHIDRRLERNRAILEKLRKGGMDLNEEELYTAKGSVGRPHIAKLLVKNGYVESVKRAFVSLIGDQSPYNDPGTPFDVAETITAIKAGGGKAFLAHPHRYHKRPFARKVLEHNFDGIECYYSKCPGHEERVWLDEAEKRGLLISGGSDFHGHFNPYINLGCSWVDKETLNKITNELH